jgi:hypothetical protein
VFIGVPRRDVIGSTGYPSGDSVNKDSLFFLDEEMKVPFYLRGEHQRIWIYIKEEEKLSADTYVCKITLNIGVNLYNSLFCNVEAEQLSVFPVLFKLLVSFCSEFPEILAMDPPISRILPIFMRYIGWYGGWYHPRDLKITQCLFYNMGWREATNPFFTFESTASPFTHAYRDQQTRVEDFLNSGGYEGLYGLWEPAKLGRSLIFSRAYSSPLLAHSQSVLALEEKLQDLKAEYLKAAAKACRPQDKGPHAGEMPPLHGPEEGEVLHFDGANFVQKLPPLYEHSSFYGTSSDS